jgi:hypothetical protein
MPITFRIGLGIAVFALASLGLISFWFSFRGGVPVVLVPITAASILSIVGLMRRVSWARKLTSALLFLAVLIEFANLMPISGRPDQHFLELWLGHMPSTQLLWAAIVLLAVFLLWPIHIFSRHRSIFRAELW